MAERMVPGAVYLERGQPVTVLASRRSTARWSPAGAVVWIRRPRRHAPMNVLIRRADGQMAVRGKRGLRRPKDTTNG